jgi:phosphopantothenoylcysteine decarboxylase
MRRNILLGVTGSVAAIKTYGLAEKLDAIGDVKIVATDAGHYFMEASKNGFARWPVLRDKDEWPENYDLGQPVPHIELRRWAAAMVIAPLDANTLAKLANGICDNLLTCVFRAWDWTRPVILCPAMNTMMWENQPTKDQLRLLGDRHPNLYVINPVEKRLACNDVGMGAMADHADIVREVNHRLRWYFPLAKCNGVPINHHPGAFGFHRRKNHHTGVDLYCEDGATVYAVEDGTVVKVDVFTGPKAGHEWWEETYGIMVEGASGVVNYGEVCQPFDMDGIGIYEGARVKRGWQLGHVKRVLFKDRHRPDIPGHSTSMLHLELYKHGTRDFADWHDPQKNPTLLDPTPYLLAAENAPTLTLTWGNEEAKTVG